MQFEVKPDTKEIIMRMSSFTRGVFAVITVRMGTSRLAPAQSTASAEDVLRQVVSALVAKDQSALNKLTVDQSEFVKFVWPVLAPRMTGMKGDKYYATYRKTSDVGIAEAAATLGSRKWTLVKSTFEPTRYKGKGYKLFGPALVTLRDEAGQENTFKLVGGLLERDGGYKVTTYYVSPSQRTSK